MNKIIIIGLISIVLMSMTVSAGWDCVIKDFGGAPPPDGSWIVTCDLNSYSTSDCCQNICLGAERIFDDGSDYCLMDLVLPAWFINNGGLEYFINATNTITTTPNNFTFYQPDIQTCTSNTGNIWYYGCTGAYTNNPGIAVDFIYTDYLRSQYGMDNLCNTWTVYQEAIDYQPDVMCNSGTGTICIYAGNQSWQNGKTTIYSNCAFPAEQGYTETILTCIQDSDCTTNYCNVGVCDVNPNVNVNVTPGTGSVPVNITATGVTDVQNITTLQIQAPTVNIVVDFTGSSINYTNIDATAIIITSRSITIDTTVSPELDKPARLSFGGVSSDYVIYRNGVECGSYCSNIQYSGGTLTFDVSGFSTYSVGLPAAEGCAATKTTVFAAFALIAIIIIVTAAFALINFSNLDALTTIAISSIGLAIVLFIGYFIISAVQTAICSV